MPDDDRFIALWYEGLTTAEIARRLGIPAGTARSRAFALQQQGKIAPRPRGGRRVRRAPPGRLPDAPLSSPAAREERHLADPDPAVTLGLTAQTALADVALAVRQLGARLATLEAVEQALSARLAALERAGATAAGPGRRAPSARPLPPVPGGGEKVHYRCRRCRAPLGPAHACRPPAPGEGCAMAKASQPGAESRRPGPMSRVPADLGTVEEEAQALRAVEERYARGRATEHDVLYARWRYGRAQSREVDRRRGRLLVIDPTPEEGQEAPC